MALPEVCWTSSRPARCRPADANVDPLVDRPLSIGSPSRQAGAQGTQSPALRVCRKFLRPLLIKACLGSPRGRLPRTTYLKPFRRVFFTYARKPKMTKPNIETESGIRCSNCGSTEFGVLQTRRAKTGILRRRQCSACGCRLTTVERPVRSGVVSMPTTGVAQIAFEARLLHGRTTSLPLPPKN